MTNALRAGGELVQRPDDREDIVKERLRVYYNQTAPLIDYYKKKGVLVEVDGEQKPEQVNEAIMKAIDGT